MTVLRFMDPFEDMDRLAASLGGQWRGGIMPMDAFERDGIYTLRFDLPGADPDAVDVTVEGSVLTVTAERPPEETEDVTWMLRERPAGTHRREVRLGDRLDSERVDANYGNGVLTVTIPMRPEARRQKIAVSSGTAEQLPG